MPAERRQVVSRIISPANGASVRPSRRRTTALPSAAAATATSVDFGRNTRSSAEFTRGLDDAAAATAAAATHNAAHNAGNTHPHPQPHAHSHAHTHPHAHNRNLSSSGFGGTGATTTTVHHRSRPSISRASRPQSVYQIVEAYRPLAYSIEKAEQEAKAAAAEKRRSLVPTPLNTTTHTHTQPPAPVAEDAMDVDEFGLFSPTSASPTAFPSATTPAAPVTPFNANEYEDDFAVLRSPARAKQEEQCISGRGMLKRGYHIILDTALEDSEEARWAAIKRMEAQLRELDKSFTRVAPPSRSRRITNVTNHTSAAAASSFSAANRAAWNI